MNCFDSTLIYPIFDVESIGDVPRVPRAHLGVGLYNETRVRKATFGWEAGDVRRARVSGPVGSGSGGAPSGLRGDGTCKADGTPPTVS